MGGQAGQGNLRGSMGMQGPGGSGGGGGGGGGGGYDNYSYDNEYDPMVMGGGMGPGYGGGNSRASARTEPQCPFRPSLFPVESRIGCLSFANSSLDLCCYLAPMRVVLY